MNLTDFKTTLNNDKPDPQWNDLLCALWWQAKDEWDTAHGIVQQLDDNTAKWIHALLHRQEGDHSNARYWYSSAGKPLPQKSLREEWEEIVLSVLDQSNAS